MKCRSTCGLLHPFLTSLLLLPAGAVAQTGPPGNDTPKLVLGGYVQPQYQTTSRDGDTSDRTLLRRLFFTLNVEASRRWRAEFQLDGGPLASNGSRPVVKNALVQYAGLEHRGLVLSLGNQKTPFSRSLLASSSRRGLIERPFTGDRGFGSPARIISARVDGWHRGGTVSWSAAVGEARHSPDREELRVEGAAEAQSGWNEGPIVAGRLEWHPQGELSRDHGDFDHGPLRLSFAGAGYHWSNDDDAPRTDDIDADHVSGIEISGALRGGGVSVDAEYEHIVSVAIDPSAQGGLYANGEAALHKASVEAGYMLIPERFEALGAVDAVDVETFAATWRRVAGGVNWYVNRHRLKFSFMHRESFNERGTRGARSHSTYLQTQFVF